MQSLRIASLLSLVAASATAQTVLHTHDGSQADGAFGTGVAFWTDRNGDGRVDYAVGAPYEDSTQIDSGRVHVFSGSDHSLLAIIDGSAAGAELGYAVANVGDLDLDGFDELGVGAPEAKEVVVLSGATAATMWTFSEVTASFGRAIAGAGDVDGDSHPDVVVGSGQSGGTGRIWVYSGATGLVLFSYADAVFRDLGYSVDGAGDVNGDGYADVIAGAPYTIGSEGGNEGGYAVIGGPSGTVITTFVLTGFANRGAEYGYSVLGVGDRNDDGFDDYAVGAREYGWIHYIKDPWIDVRSGADHSILWTVTGPSDSYFASSLALGGDLDRDGYDDLLVGNAVQSVHAYSIERDVELFTLLDYPNVGQSVAGGTDIDADTFPDMLTGQGDALGQAAGSGKVTVFTWGCPPDAGYNYCTSVPNSSGQAGTITYQNSLEISQNNLRLIASNLPTNQFGIFFYGRSPGQIPFGDGFRCVTGQIFRYSPQSTGGGGASRLIDLDALPQGDEILPGETIFWQFWFRDPAAGGAGWNLTDGLRTTFCP